MSYELASVCPSILLPSRSFLGIGSLVFSETQHGVRGLCGFVRDRARFFEEKKIVPNMVKLGLNGPETGFFELSGNLVIYFL